MQTAHSGPEPWVVWYMNTQRALDAISDSRGVKLPWDRQHPVSFSTQENDRKAQRVSPATCIWAESGSRDPLFIR